MFAARIILFAVCAAIINAAQEREICSTAQKGLIVGMKAKHPVKLIKNQMETVIVKDKCASKGLSLVGVSVRVCDTRDTPLIHIQTLKAITVYRMTSVRVSPARMSIIHHCALPNRAGFEPQEE